MHQENFSLQPGVYTKLSIRTWMTTENAQKYFQVETAFHLASTYRSVREQWWYWGWRWMDCKCTSRNPTPSPSARADSWLLCRPSRWSHSRHPLGNRSLSPARKWKRQICTQLIYIRVWGCIVLFGTSAVARRERHAMACSFHCHRGLCTLTVWQMFVGGMTFIRAAVPYWKRANTEDMVQSCNLSFSWAQTREKFKCSENYWHF